MKIGIDARFYGPHGTGIGRYVQKLITYLEQVDHDNEYVIFLQQDNFNQYKPSNPNFRKVIADYKWYTLEEQIKFPKTIKHHKVDLMHFPHFNVPLFYNKKFIVTIHDLILTKFPTIRASKLSPIMYWFKHLMYRLIISHAAKKSKKIITFAEYTKNEIIKTFGVSETKIAITDESADLQNGIAADKNILNSYEIKSPYILYVGNVYPHKNLDRLINANLKIDGMQLVIGGRKDYFLNRLESETRSRGIGSDQVIFTGFISDEVLRTLYQNADVYVFPSLYEGFGLPPLEAMNEGCPVASSDQSCLPEILGDAVLYFDPLDVNSIAESIKRILSSDELRNELITKGKEQVKKFSWERCASQTLKLYRDE